MLHSVRLQKEEKGGKMGGEWFFSWVFQWFSGV
jgi:hypothetical protein